MSAINTITALEQFCNNQTGNSQTWTGKSGIYQWNIGRSNTNGLVNGVVRKLAGIDNTGKEIWVVAGSMKIDVDGSILRFTGLSKKDQSLISGISKISTQVKSVAAKTTSNV